MGSAEELDGAGDSLLEVARVAVEDDRDRDETLTLILTHPVTGGRTASFDYPVRSPAEEQDLRAKLFGWANGLADRSERLRGL